MPIKMMLKYCFKLICVSVHKSCAQNLHVLLPPVGVGAIQNTPRQSVALPPLSRGDILRLKTSALSCAEGIPLGQLHAF
jgi:hypothetical protein